MACSGTGGMEASVCNLLSLGDHVITVEGGKFGERWTEICIAYGIDSKVIEGEWGCAVDPNEIKKALDEDPSIKAVYITLCETSTGASVNIKAIGEIVKDTKAVLVVDAVSGLAVTDLQADNWNVDVVVSGGHKGFMLPPGLGFVSISPKAFALTEKSKCPKYYFDFNKAKKAADKTDTPFTPAIGLVIALNESIKLIKDKGLEETIKHFEKLAEGARAGFNAIGLPVFTHESARNNVLTAVNVPDGIDGEKLVKELRDTHGISIAGGQGHLKGKIIRVAHMGCLDENDILKGLSKIEIVLSELGHKFQEGAAVDAAKEVFQK